MKKKLLSHVKFSNGAHYKCYLYGKVPKLAKDANDYIFLEITPEKGRGEKGAYYMNIYDANNLIWVLSQAILMAHEQGFKVLPNK